MNDSTRLHARNAVLWYIFVSEILTEREKGMLTREAVIACIPRLRWFARKLTQDYDLAEELLSATIERALNRLNLYKPIGKPYSWLCRMMQNLWIDEKRHQQVQRRADSAAAPRHIDKKNPPQLATLMLAKVRERCKELPSGWGDLVLAVGEEGLSYKQAADRFGIPIGTVMSRLARARALLSKEFSLDDYI